MDTPDANFICASGILKRNKEKIARENHSEIERRRRNKMNHYIRELSSIIPGIEDHKKIDKLTILKTTVQYIRLLRDYSEPPTITSSQNLNMFEEMNTSNNISADSNISFLTSREFRQVLMESANGFMFVYSTATTKILYVSDVVGIILGHKKEMLEGKSILELVHQDDHFKLNANLLKMNDQLESVSMLGNSIETNSTETPSSASQDFFPRSDITIRIECDNSDDFYGLDSVYPYSLCSNVKKFCCSQRFKDYNNVQALKDYIVAHCCLSLMKFRDVGFNVTQNPRLYDGETLDTMCVVGIGYIPPNNVNSIKNCDQLSNFEDTLKQPSDSKLIFQLDKSGKIIYIQKPTNVNWLDKLVNVEEFNDKPVNTIIYESDQDIFMASFKKALENYKKNSNVTVIVKLKMSGIFIRTFVTFNIVTNAYNENIECILMECEDMQDQDSTTTFQPVFFGHPLKRSLDLPTMITSNDNQPQDHFPSYTYNKSMNSTTYASSTNAVGQDYYMVPRIKNGPLILDNHLCHSVSGIPDAAGRDNPITQCNSQQLAKSVDFLFSNAHANNNTFRENDSMKQNFTTNIENYTNEPNSLGYIWNIFNLNDPNANNNSLHCTSFQHMNNDHNYVAPADANSNLNYPDPSKMMDQLKLMQSNQKMNNNIEFVNFENPPINPVPVPPNNDNSAVHYYNQYYGGDNNYPSDNVSNNELFSMFFRSGQNSYQDNQQHKPNS